ncbi:cyclin-dependent protein kinase inhibitor SMR1 [Senna tora]|uniref:Cyclin-dependent protein kinase inhibitor SMR1 n=1 Tax=Senna tora TaxID=362788 RepID=A0A834WAB9_9FABA|nr:cyclin-dependent protein kinase inhibitor SMR1 [Senna tora]
MPRIRLRISDDRSVLDPTDQNDGVSIVQKEREPDQSEIVHDDDDEGFRTPTSEESKIPAMLTCPPAPRKLPAKRKMREPLTPKKRCRCCRFLDHSEQNDGVSIVQREREMEHPDIVDDEEEGFRTPTSEERKIPAMVTCPPAPRKLLGKRKIREEPLTPKKRCRCYRCI